MQDLKVGHFVEINDDFFEVRRLEPFEYRTGQESTTFFSDVSSGGTQSGYINITELEPDDNPKRLFKVDWGIMDGMLYQMKIPTGSARFGTDESKEIGKVDNMISPWYAPNENFSFWLIKDYYPAINAINNTRITQTPRIYFRGVKYDIDPVRDKDKENKLRAGTLPVLHVTLGGVRI